MHPSDGTLRRTLDEPDAVDAANRKHVAACARCAARVQRMSADAGWVQAMLPAHDPAVDVPGARARLAAHRGSPPRTGSRRGRTRDRCAPRTDERAG